MGDGRSLLASLQQGREGGADEDTVLQVVGNDFDTAKMTVDSLAKITMVAIHDPGGLAIPKYVSTSLSPPAR